MKKILILFLLVFSISSMQAKAVEVDDSNPTEMVKMQTDLNVDVVINNQTVVFDTVDIGLDIPTNNYISNQKVTSGSTVNKTLEMSFDVPINRSNWGYQSNLQKYTFKQIYNKQIFSRADFEDTIKIPISGVTNYITELRTC